MGFQENMIEVFTIGYFIISDFMVQILFFLQLIFNVSDFALFLLKSASVCSFFLRCKYFWLPDGFQLYTGMGGYPVLDRCFNFIHKIGITLQGASRPWGNSKIYNEENTHMKNITMEYFANIVNSF